MDKKTIIVLIISAIATIILVGAEVYCWKNSSFQLLSIFKPT